MHFTKISHAFKFFFRAKELADCENAAAEVRKLKSMLEELGVRGRPTLEKCEAIKKERELKAELDSLDTSLIMNDTGRRTRTRNNAQSKPSYAVDDSSSSEEEEEEEEDDDDESENENKDGNEEEKGSNKSETKADNNTLKEPDSEDEESSGVNNLHKFDKIV
jgi:Mg-chelatase subunit ChlI